MLRDPYVLLVQAGSELAERDSGAAASASSAACRSSPGATSASRRRYLRGRVPDLNIVFRSDDNGTLVGLVAEGLGVAVVPQLVVNPRNPAYVALPFGNRIPPRHLAIVWHRDRYPLGGGGGVRRAREEPVYRTVQRVGGQYVATTGPMNALRCTGAPRARVARADPVVAHHEVLASRRAAATSS